MEKVIWYDIMQITFGDREHFPVRCIASCRSKTTALNLISTYSKWHEYEIVERVVIRN